jgi:hypothetical protein
MAPSTTPARSPRKPLVAGPDGQNYSASVNDDIDSLAAGTFGTSAGQRFLQYLEGITTRRVLGPEATDSHLRHLEGARWLVGVIRQRIVAGKKGNE